MVQRRMLRQKVEKKRTGISDEDMGIYGGGGGRKSQPHDRSSHHYERTQSGESPRTSSRTVETAQRLSKRSTIQTEAPRRSLTQGLDHTSQSASEGGVQLQRQSRRDSTRRASTLKDALSTKM